MPAMISRIRIENFKSLHSVDLSLSPVTVLIGRGGTGKTNFVNALRFLRDLLIHGDTAVSAHGGWNRILPVTAPETFRLAFELVFEAPGISGDVVYQLAFTKSPESRVPQFTKERLSLGRHVLFHQEGDRWVIRPMVAKPPDPGSIAIGRIHGIQEVTIAYLVLSRGIGCYDFPAEVLQRNVSAPGSTGLLDKGENFIPALDALLSNLSLVSHWKEVNTAFGLLSPSIKNLDIDRPVASTVTVAHQVGEEILNFNISQESEGFRRFIAHLVALYQSPQKQLLVFDGPEKSMYPRVLSVLADQIKACARSGRAQVLLTTNSPELLNAFGPDSIRVVEIEDFSTRIGPLASDQRKAIEDGALTAGELLIKDQARLEQPAEGV
jgi:predicted ATPase